MKKASLRGRLFVALENPRLDRGFRLALAIIT